MGLLGSIGNFAANAATGGLYGGIKGAVQGYHSGGIDGALTGYLGGHLAGTLGLPGGNGDNAGGASGGFNPPKFNEAADAPEIGGLRDMISGMKGPQSVDAGPGFTPDNSTYQGQVYKAQDFSGPLAEFNTMRQQTNQDFNQQQSAQQDATARRFAAMGNLNSGAYAKASQSGDLALNQEREKSLNQIGFNEAQQRRNLQQQEQNKVFQSGEANQGRRFQFGQTQSQRNFEGEQTATQRRLQAQEFNTGQQNDFNKFKEQAGAQVAQMDAQQRQFQEQLAQDQYQGELNRYTQQHSGGLLGSGGILGTGLG